MSSQNLSVAQRFGPRLKELRNAAGLTQEALARQMTERGHQWLQTTVTKTEAATRPLLLDEFVTLCDLLDQNPVWALSYAQGVARDREHKMAALSAQIRNFTDVADRATAERDVAVARREDLREQLEALRAEEFAERRESE